MLKSWIVVVALFFVAGVCGANAWSARLKIERGLYEMTVENHQNLPTLSEGAKQALRKQTHRYCVKETDPQSFVGEVFKGTPCKAADFKETGNQISWTSACQGGVVEMKGEGNVVFEGRAYHGKHKSVAQIPGGYTVTIESVYTGKRLGDCPK